jgi:hypothetical protein
MGYSGGSSFTFTDTFNWLPATTYKQGQFFYAPDGSRWVCAIPYVSGTSFDYAGRERGFAVQVATVFDPSQVGNTIAPLDPTTHKVNPSYLPPSAGFSTRDLGNVSGNITIDVSVTSDVTLTLIGNTVITFSGPLGWIGQWRVRVKQNSVGGFTCTFANVTRTPSHGAIPAASGANSETDYEFLSRDGALATINCVQYVPDEISVVTVDAATLALAPTGFWKLTETSGTSFADSSVSTPTAATLAGTGGLYAQSTIVPIPSDPSSVCFNTQGTAYITLPKRITNNTASWTYQIIVTGDDTGTPSLVLLSEGLSTDTTHLYGCFAVSADKDDTQNLHILYRTTNGPGGSVNDLVSTICTATPFDGNSHILHITNVVSGGTYTMKVYDNGNLTDTFSNAMTGLYSVDRATVAAFGRDTYTSKFQAGVSRVAQWSSALTPAQISSIASAFLGGTSTPKHVWLSGAYRDGVVQSSLNTYAAARGRAVDLETFFPQPDNCTWAQIEAVGGVNSTYTSDPAWMGVNSSRIIYSCNMLPFDATQTLAIGATGAYDFHWTNLATNLKNANRDYQIMRLGWEQDVAYFNSSYKNARVSTSAAQAMADWRTYYQRIVNAMRAVSPNFKFLWNPQLVSYQTDQTYPGDGFVDYVGLDGYGYTPDTNSPIYQPGDQSILWQKICSGNGNNGLQFWTRFCRAGASRLDGSAGAGVLTTSTVAKPMCFPEWGVLNPEYQSGHGCGDSAYYINKMFSYMRTHKNFAWESYFEHNVTGNAGSPGVQGDQGPFSGLFESGSNQYGYVAAKNAYVAGINP